MRRDVREHIAANIKNHGQQRVCVHATAGDTGDFIPFVYTIGNHERGLPELLLIGDNDAVYCQILNILGETQRQRGRAFDLGELVDFSAMYPALVGDGGRRGRQEYAVQASVYYGTENFRVQQIFLSDSNGYHYNQPEFDVRYLDCPILADKS